MKMKVFLIWIIVVIIVASSLCGCADVDGKIQSSTLHTTVEQSSVGEVTSTNNSYSSPISDGKESLPFDEIPANPTSCRIYQLKRRAFTEQQLINCFNGIPEKIEDTNENATVYEMGDQRGQLVNGRNLIYYTQKGELLEEFYWGLSSDLNKEYISYEDNLEFASREEVLENVRNKLSEGFGIKPNEWYAKDFCAVKKGGIEYYKQIADKDANESWENADDLQKEKEKAERLNSVIGEDFYYITIKFKIDEIPMFTGGMLGYGTMGYEILGSNCYIIYTQKGIENIALYYTKEIDVSAHNIEEVELISAGKAQELIREKYDGIFFDGEIEIYDMQLVYLPIPQNDLEHYNERFEARPYYAFYCEKEEYRGNETVHSNFVSYYDAVTGEEFTTQQLEY